jgi:hypothetical protein
MVRRYMLYRPYKARTDCIGRNYGAIQQRQGCWVAGVCCIFLFLFSGGRFPNLRDPCQLGSYLNEKLILKGKFFEEVSNV